MGISARCKVLAVSAVALSLLAACSSSGGSSGGSSAGESSSASGTIKLFQAVPTQGEVSSLPFMETAAKAAVAEVNAAGGVNGRKLELTTCNDQLVTDLTLRCVRDAILDKDTVAMVGSLTTAGAQIAPLLEQARLADVGTDPVVPQDMTSKTSFPIDPGLASYAGMLGVAKKYLSATKVAVLNSDTAATPTNNAFYDAGTKLTGVQIVKKLVVPVDTTDFTPYVNQAKDAGAEAIVTPMQATAVLATWKALQQTGSSLKLVSSDSSAPQSLIDQAGGAAEGNYTLGGIPSGDESNPYGAEYVAAMKKYQPQEKTYGSLGLRAYASVKLFAKVAGTIHGDVTRSSVLDAFNKTHGLKFMWIPSLSYNAPGPLSDYPRVPTALAFPGVIKSGKVTSLPTINFAKS